MELQRHRDEALRLSRPQRRDPVGEDAFAFAATRSAEVRPTTSILRIYRLPCLVMEPSFVLPPVEFCFGVSPSQAAKSRPDLKTPGSGTLAAITEAISGPTPISARP
jgi:hypothetical protein